MTEARAGEGQATAGHRLMSSAADEWQSQITPGPPLESLAGEPPQGISPWIGEHDAEGFSLFDLASGQVAKIPQRALPTQDAEHLAGLLNRQELALSTAD